MNRTFILGTFAALSLLLSACADVPTTEEGSAEPAADKAEPAADKENVGQSKDALFTGPWTAWTSDELPPVSCPSGYVADAMATTGSNADNIALHCGNIGRSAYNQAWSSYFSEEGTNYAICGTNRFIVGVACSGNDCDNMSIECASFTNTTRGSNCYWTPWFSEEQEYQYLSTGYAAVGLECSGNNCDNMSIYACPVSLN